MSTVVVDLALFSRATGYYPLGGLYADAEGNLYGTASSRVWNGTLYNMGTVFEIPKVGSGYGALTVLVSFDGSNGEFPSGGLISDSSGNLFGTTAEGGANGTGTVFEIAKTSSGYATTPTTLVSFGFNTVAASYPLGTLFADAKGNLIGTTSGDIAHGGVFEITKTATGYATTPTMLATFNKTNGAYSTLR